MLNRVIAKTLVFDKDGDVLILVRSDDDMHRPGDYDLPGGKVDEGENYVAAAAREAMEEAGLKLDPDAMHLTFCTTKVATHEESGDDVNLIWLGFVTKLATKLPVALSHEHKAYGWHPIDEAIKLSQGLTLGSFLLHIRDNGILEDYWRKE